jgi:hypothetical protein
MNYAALLNLLHAEGLCSTPAVPARPDAMLRSPWIARVLLGVCGWWAGLLVLGGLGGLFSNIFDSVPALAVTSGILIGGAALLYGLARGNEFAAQFALAASIAGQLAVAALIDRLGVRDQRIFAWLLCALQLVLVAIMFNPLHRTLSTLFALAALWFSLRGIPLGRIATVVLAVAVVALWRSEDRWLPAQRESLIRPVAVGLALALLLWEWPALWEIAWLELSSRARPQHISAVLQGVTYMPALLLLAWPVLKSGRAADKALAIAGILTLAILAVRAPGVTAIALVALSLFSAGQRALVYFSLIAGIAYLGIYYYQLDVTLLEKSIALMLGGMACWVGFALMRFAARAAGGAR